MKGSYSLEAAGRKIYPAVVIGLISCSMLMYEILLTRVCALRLYFHFGFLVVSNCLLGIGASGSLITVFQDRLKRNERQWIFGTAALYVISALIAYVILLNIHLEPGVNFKNLKEVLQFASFNFVAAVPFFFSGATVGMLLTFNSENVNRIYCIDLLGAEPPRPCPAALRSARKQDIRPRDRKNVV